MGWSKVHSGGRKLVRVAEEERREGDEDVRVAREPERGSVSYF